MAFLDIILGKLDPQKRAIYQRLFCEEINMYLGRVYQKVGKKQGWKRIHLKPYQVELIDTSSGENKQWVVHLMPPENLKKGDMGKISATSNRIGWDVFRSQRALFIAAELYVYHAFALQKDVRWLERVRLQNHYKDMWNHITGKECAEHVRDKALQYLIHAMGEETLARYSPKGIFMSMRKLTSHEKDIAKILGASEKDFERAKKPGKLGIRKLMREVTIIDHEISHIDQLITLLDLDIRERKKLGQDAKRIDQHIAKLKSFRKTLSSILRKHKNWTHDSKKHNHIRKLSFRFAHDHAKRELDRHEVDIGKVYAVMGRFKNEKLNIVRDLESLDKKLARAV